MIKNQIAMYKHCPLCMFELPSDVAMRDWARLNVGVTEEGLQVWCVRHDMNVLALDFLGQKIAFDEEGPPRTKEHLNKLRRTGRIVRDRGAASIRAGKFVDDGALAALDEQLAKLDADVKALSRPGRRRPRPRPTNPG
jgi:hypothetical protein